MARSGDGTFSLVAGNPVVAATVIDPDWANDTLTDIADALTDSLSRSGNGDMSVVLTGVNGELSGPAYSFASEPTSGLYRSAAGNLGVSCLGVAVLQLGAAACQLSSPVADGSGAVANIEDTEAAFSTGYLKEWRNNGTALAALDSSGNLELCKAGDQELEKTTSGVLTIKNTARDVKLSAGALDINSVPVKGSGQVAAACANIAFAVGTGSVVSGYNVGTPVIQTATTFRVPFSTNLPNANFMVLAQCTYGGYCHNLYPAAKNVGYVDLYVFDTTTGNTQTLTGVSYSFDIVVFAVP